MAAPPRRVFDRGAGNRRWPRLALPYSRRIPAPGSATSLLRDRNRIWIAWAWLGLGFLLPAVPDSIAAVERLSGPDLAAHRPDHHQFPFLLSSGSSGACGGGRR